MKRAFVIIIAALVALSPSSAQAGWKRYLPFQYFVIPQNGMYPTLPPNSQFRCNNYAYSNISHVKYGDIIVFQHVWEKQDTIFVWRVVGLPGDHMVTRGQDLSLGGKQAEHTALRHEPDAEIYQERINGADYQIAFLTQFHQQMPEADLVVPPDHVFVLGDNRFNALDSRILGSIPFQEIICRKD